MRISLRYYNIVADFLGRREEERQVMTGTTVAGLVQALASESSSLEKLALVPGGGISSHVRLFRNGWLVTDLDQTLADGDELRLFPTISGG